jgi:3-hydroxyacyl-[acyl-carrier-protein] dehydratase
LKNGWKRSSNRIEKMDKIFDIQKIMDVLPHRYPFILVDRILEIVPGEKVVALKNVTINEPFFQGHFPGVPIMPGVLIVEAMAQAGVVLAAELPSRRKGGDLAFFMGMDKVRFRKPVVPGDQLILEMKILRKRAKVFKMSGTARVDGNLVAEAELMAAFGDKP